MMMNNNPCRMLPQGDTKKRNHDEAFFSTKLAKTKAIELISPNQLLAGYLAHEFLTKGTLFGQRFNLDSTRAEAVPLASSASADPNRNEVNSQEMEPTKTGPSMRKENESYGEVASIMKIDGNHIKGIVNPTQLSQWIHM